MTGPFRAVWVASLAIAVLCVLASPSHVPRAGAQESGPCGEEGHTFWLLGDLYIDCQRNMADVVRLIDHIYLHPDEIVNVTADVDCSGIVDTVDLVMLVDFCFRAGPDFTPCQE